MSVEKMNLYVNVGFTILMIIIGIFAIRALRQYFVKKEITGNLVLHLPKSPKTIVISSFVAGAEMITYDRRYGFVFCYYDFNYKY